MPEPPKFVDGWQLGTPDLVVKMPQPFKIPADGPDIYRCFVIPIPTDHDRMVSAVEFRPGNRKVVHHAIMFLDANGEARKKDKLDGQPGFESFGGPGVTPTGGLGGWAPGAMPRFMPPGVVKYLKKQSDLVLQVHYHPDGKPETDQSTVGIYFSKVPWKKIVTGIAVMQTGLQLPAGEAHCEVKAETEALPVDVWVVGVSPHMHNLGREMKVTATRPDREDPIPLVWIKDWDFNWQGQYLLKKPIRLPKGSKIFVEAVYDNSADNPKNPNDPPKEVHWGEQTSDEMCLCSVAVYTYQTADLRHVSSMAGHEIGAGIDGGVPGAANRIKRELAQKAAEKRQAAKAETKNTAAKSSVSKRRGGGDGVLDDGPPPKSVASSPPPAETSAGKPQVAAKKSKTALPPFPKQGVALSPSAAVVLGQFDKDQDGRLSLAEFEKLDPSLQATIRRKLTETEKTGK